MGTVARICGRAGMAAVLLSLSGCVGAALHLARAGRHHGHEAAPAERIVAAQQQALDAAHGGGPDTPVAWSDPASGLQGSFVAEPGAAAANGCRRYRQTVILHGETLRGPLQACPQPDGSWQVQG